jgi:hypothetical protein
LQTIEKFGRRKFKYDLFEITMLPRQQEHLTTFSVSRNPQYLGYLLCKFRDHILQREEIIDCIVRYNVKTVGSVLKVQTHRMRFDNATRLFSF